MYAQYAPSASSQHLPRRHVLACGSCSCQRGLPQLQGGTLQNNIQPRKSCSTCMVRLTLSSLANYWYAWSISLFNCVYCGQLQGRAIIGCWPGWSSNLRSHTCTCKRHQSNPCSAAGMSLRQPKHCMLCLGFAQVLACVPDCTHHAVCSTIRIHTHFPSHVPCPHATSASIGEALASVPADSTCMRTCMKRLPCTSGRILLLLAAIAPSAACCCLLSKQLDQEVHQKFGLRSQPLDITPAVQAVALSALNEAWTVSVALVWKDDWSHGINATFSQDAAKFLECAGCSYFYAAKATAPHLIPALRVLASRGIQIGVELHIGSSDAWDDYWRSEEDCFVALHKWNQAELSCICELSCDLSRACIGHRLMTLGQEDVEVRHNKKSMSPELSPLSRLAPASVWLWEWLHGCLHTKTCTF